MGRLATVRDWLRSEMREDWDNAGDLTPREVLHASAETLLAVAVWFRIVSHALLFRALAGRETDMQVSYRLRSGPQVWYADRDLTLREDLELRVYSAGLWAYFGVGLWAGGGFGLAAPPALLALAGANWAWLVLDPLAILLGNHGA